MKFAAPKTAFRSSLKKRLYPCYGRLIGLACIGPVVVDSHDTATAWVVNEKLVKVVGYEKPEDILGIALTLVIAFFTVSYRSFRTAITNPVDVLRAE